MPRQPEATRAVYVRLPLSAAEKLDDAAARQGASKRDVITHLLDHLDPHAATARHGAGIHGAQATPRRIVVEDTAEGLTVGHARFTPAPADAVLTLEEAADLLRVAPAALEARAEAGDVPARRIGDAWRFRRDALLAWLGGEGAPDGEDVS